MWKKSKSWKLHLIDWIRSYKKIIYKLKRIVWHIVLKSSFKRKAICTIFLILSWMLNGLNWTARLVHRQARPGSAYHTSQLVLTLIFKNFFISTSWLRVDLHDVLLFGSPYLTFIIPPKPPPGFLIILSVEFAFVWVFYCTTKSY